MSMYGKKPLQYCKVISLQLIKINGKKILIFPYLCSMTFRFIYIFLPSYIPSPVHLPYPFQYSWASLVAQLVNNSPAVQEIWVGKNLYRRKRLPTPVFWPGEFHGLYGPWGHTNGWTQLNAFHFTHQAI